MTNLDIIKLSYVLWNLDTSSDSKWLDLESNKFNQRIYHAVLLFTTQKYMEFPISISIHKNFDSTNTRAVFIKPVWRLHFDNFINDRSLGLESDVEESKRLIYYSLNTNYTTLVAQHRRCVGVLMLKCVISNYTIQRILMSIWNVVFSIRIEI